MEEPHIAVERQQELYRDGLPHSAQVLRGEQAPHESLYAEGLTLDVGPPSELSHGEVRLHVLVHDTSELARAL